MTDTVKIITANTTTAIENAASIRQRMLRSLDEAAKRVRNTTDAWHNIGTLLPTESESRTVALEASFKLRDAARAFEEAASVLRNVKI
jgi:hypothetical protein